MGCTLLFMDFPANDLATVDVFNQVEVVEAPLQCRGKIGDVPAPHLLGANGGALLFFEVPFC